MSENNKNFYEKLILVQKAIKGKITKNAQGRSGGGVFKYADLDHILDVVLPELHNQGLTVVSFIKDMAVHTLITDGITEIKSEYVLPSYSPAATSKAMQDMGACITYAKRYNISSLLMLDTDNDVDDSNINDKPQPKPVSKPTQPAKQLIEQKEDFDLDTFNSLNAVEELTAYFKKLNNADEFKPLFAEKRKLIETLESFKTATAFNAWFTGLNVDYKKQITANHSVLLDMYMGNIK